MSADPSGDMSSAVNRRVGELLREVRRGRRLALQEVEAQSGEEFKASVLGAYERGERAVSVPRLVRLASFYEVPLGRLLPAADDGTLADEFRSDAGRLALDLDALADLAGRDGGYFDVLRRFCRAVQMMRGDLRGRELVIRASDRPTIAAMLDVPVDEVADRLQYHGLLVRHE